jgi:hypothetical protein
MSTALAAGLLGLVGTIVGATLTTWTAHHTADRSAQHAREELRRQEERSAVIQFASALGIYRTAEIDRWHARHGGFRDVESSAADVYRTRTAAWNAYYVLELSTNNRDLGQQARRAIDRAESIKDPDSQAEMDQRAEQVSADLAELITMARAWVNQGVHRADRARTISLPSRSKAVYSGHRRRSEDFGGHIRSVPCGCCTCCCTLCRR